MPPSASSRNSAKHAAPAPRKLLGRTEPRLWTPPLRPLNRRTSLGYECCDFMEKVAGEPFDPWQEWVVKHALELMPDGSFRFRIILILVARQNGKALDADTELLTSRGFVKLWDISEGDEVYHPSGHLTQVIAVSEIMHGHQCYRVAAADGRSVVADRDHLWLVTDTGRNDGPPAAVTLATGEMAAATENRFVLPHQKSRSLATAVASIEPVESRPVRCIQVESPDGLFLAGRDLIPTHNSHLKRGVSVWRMYMNPKSRILGVAQEVTLAREQWNMCQDVIHASPDLEAEWGNVRNVNGDEYFWLANGSRYKIGAANRKSGRGGSNDEVNIDELREQRSWDAWAALSKTTMARGNSQIWCMSNAGDDQSVVLNQLLEVARAGTDPTIFLAEYSAPDGCELDDWDAIRQANPNLGRRISAQAIKTAMSTDPPAVLRTEVMCQRVEQLDGAIDTARWDDCADAAGTLDAHRKSIAACLDIAPDGQHATLAVAARLADGRVRVEISAAWPDTEAARAELPALLGRIKPVSFGWYPGGPAAGIATTLRPLARKYNKRPGGKRDPADIPEDGAITGPRVTEACQELADLVKALRIVHPADPLLDAHARGASKLDSGDGWRFTRKGEGHVDAAYAAAGAVKLALTMPQPKRARVRMISA